MWTQLFSVFTVLVSLVIVLKEFPPEIRDVRYLSITALSVWLLGDIVIAIHVPFQDTLHVLLQSLSLAILLIILLIFIRSRKPVLFRYPYYIVFIPLLIPVAQFITMETEIMRKIIFMTLHGVAIAVYILLSAGYRKELSQKLITIVGVVLLLWGFAFFWILQNYYIVFDWAWGVTNSLGVMACTYSFSDLLKINIHNKF